MAEQGLSRNEAKVYLSLLETGPASATKIAEVSKIHRVNVYDSVEKLRGKGLVGSLTQNGKRLFQASPPDILMNLIEAKKIKLQSILPQLQLATKLSQNKSEVEVYEGYDFVRNLYIHYTEKKEDIYVFGIPIFSVQKIGKDFQETLHRRRAKTKQKMYHIYNSDAWERARFLNTLPCTLARSLAPEFDQTVATRICGDEIAITAYADPEQKPYSIYIHNKQIADAYLKYFWILWEKAIEPTIEPK